MMGEEVFQLHVVTPTYATGVHVLRLFTKSDKKQTQQNLLSSFSAGVQPSSFPAGEKKGLLSLLVLYRVFFPAGASQGLLSLLMLYKFSPLKFCHADQTKWPLVIKHIIWVDNHQMIITPKYDSHHLCAGENAI